jgi:ribosome biogenesis GTPase A
MNCEYLLLTIIRGIDPNDPDIRQQDIAAAREAIGYIQGARNIVFAGNLNAGKSSLINAIRHRSFGDDDYAPTGAAEVTLEHHRYPSATVQNQL